MSRVDDLPQQSEQPPQKASKRLDESSKHAEKREVRYLEESFVQDGKYRNHSVNITPDTSRDPSPESSRPSSPPSEPESDQLQDNESNYGSLRYHPLHLLQFQRRPPLPKLAILQAKIPKKTDTRQQMEKMLAEVTLRSGHKLKEISTHAQDLFEQAEILRDENRALKRLQKQQTKEMDDKTMFVRAAQQSVMDMRKAVRYTEEDCAQMSDSLRKKNKRILRLRDECARYERLLAEDRRLPSQEELERRIEKVEERLAERDKKIEELNEQMKEADKKAAQIHHKENKRQNELRNDIQERTRECDELKKRIKVHEKRKAKPRRKKTNKLDSKNAEKRIHNTNVYARKQQPSLGPAAKLVAITWYPPNKEEHPDHKVKNWLKNNVNEH